MAFDVSGEIILRDNTQAATASATSGAQRTAEAFDALDAASTRAEQSLAQLSATRPTPDLSGLTGVATEAESAAAKARAALDSLASQTKAQPLTFTTDTAGVAAQAKGVADTIADRVKATPLPVTLDVRGVDRQIGLIETRLSTLRNQASVSPLSPADVAEFRKLEGELRNLRSIRTSVEINTQTAEQRIQQLTAEIARLERRTQLQVATVVDTQALARARSELDTLRRAQKPITIDANTQPAQARLADLARQIDALQAKARSKSITIGEVGQLRSAQAEVRGLQSALNGTTESAGGLAGMLGGKLAGALSVAGLVAAAGQALRLTAELGQLGAQAITTEQSFSSMLRSVGAAPDLLNRLQGAASGTITDMRLMQLANTALAGASDDMAAAFADALPQLIQGARAANQLNPALGDVEFLFSSLVTGIKRGSPMLIDNTGITLKLGEANAAYAKSLGKTVDALTAEEQKMALLNATLNGVAGLVAQAGGNLDNMTTKVQTLKTATEELKTELGRLVAKPYTVVITAVTKGVTEVTDRIQSGRLLNDANDVTRSVQDRITALQAAVKLLEAEKAKAVAAGEDAFGPHGMAKLANQKTISADSASIAAANQMIAQLQAYGAAADAVQAKQAALATAERALSVATTDLANAKAGGTRVAQQYAQTVYATALAERDAAQAALIAAQAQGRNVALADAYAASQRKAAADTFSVAPAAQAAAEAVEQYKTALGQVAAQQNSPAALGQFVGKLQNLSAPQLPTISGPAIGVDYSAINAAVDAYARLGDAQAAAAAQARPAIALLQAEQAARLQTIRSMSDHAAALQLLATEYLGAGASVLDLAAKFDTLPPALQAVARELGITEASLAALQSRANQGVTLEMRLNGMREGMSSIDSMALKLVGVLNPTQIRQYRDRALAEYGAFYKTLNTQDEFGLQLSTRAWLEAEDAKVTAVTAANRQITDSTRATFADIANSASELKGKIEGALKLGTEVTPADQAATDAGTYQDKPLESARRLDAIAQRGFSELQAHPDWAALLKIPDSVLNGTEAELKAWAAQTKADVVDLARPDLINWDAFVANFKAGLDKEAAQKMTIDIAVDKLTAAGLLSGSEEDRRKKVAQALGIEDTTTRIDAIFAPQKGAAAKLLTDLLGPEQTLSVPVKFVAPPLTSTPAPPAGPGDTLPAGRAPTLTAPPAGVTGTRPPALTVQPTTTTTAPAPPAPPAGATSSRPPTATAAGPQLPAWNTGTLLDATALANTTGTALAGAAPQIATSFKTSLVTAIEAQKLGTGIASTVSADTVANLGVFTQAGTLAGNATGDAFRLAVRTNVGAVRSEMAALLAPEVAAILNRTNGARP